MLKMLQAAENSSLVTEGNRSEAVLHWKRNWQARHADRLVKAKFKKLGQEFTLLGGFHPSLPDERYDDAAGASGGTTKPKAAKKRKGKKGRGR